MKKFTFLILLAVCSISCFGQIPPYIPTSGLIAWYPFTGNAIDSSGNGNNGVLNGDATYGTDRFGVANRCFLADGMSAIDYPVNDFPLGNPECTVSAFFKLGFPLPLGERNLFSWGNNSYLGGRFGLEVVDDTTIGVESAGGGVLSHFTPDTFWHNFTFTYPASGLGFPSVKIYVDGVLLPIDTIINPLGAFNITSSFIHCAGSLFLGPSYLYGWIGKLDDIAIWNRELSSCEVERVFYGPTSLIPVITATGDTISTANTYSSYQWTKNGTVIPGATNNTYTTTTGGTYAVIVSTHGGCTDTSSAYRSTLSTTNIYMADEIKIFPNPSASAFSIQSPIPVNIILMNLEGQIIQKKDRVTQIEMGTLPKGIYLLDLYDENGLRIKTERINWIGN